MAFAEDSYSYYALVSATAAKQRRKEGDKSSSSCLCERVKEVAFAFGKNKFMGAIVSWTKSRSNSKKHEVTKTGCSYS